MTGQMIFLTLVSLSAITLLVLELVRRKKDLREEQKKGEFLRGLLDESDKVRQDHHREAFALRDRSRRLAQHVNEAQGEVTRLQRKLDGLLATIEPHSVGLDYASRIIAKVSKEYRAELGADEVVLRLRLPEEVYGLVMCVGTHERLMHNFVDGTSEHIAHTVSKGLHRHVAALVKSILHSQVSELKHERP